MRNKKQNGFAKKSLGQNFLNSTAVRDQILGLAYTSSEDSLEDGDFTKDFPQNVLEIGPGLGFMTNQLIKKAKNRFVAVEMDDRAVELLHRDFDHRDNFELIHGDILRQDIDSIFEQQNYSVIANIPYNITSPILRKFLSKTKNKPDQMILMVQKEVADKITVDPFNGKRSILSISVEIYAEPRFGFFVGRDCFDPAPRVDSAVIHLITRDKPLVDPELEMDFFTVVNGGFSEKRKKLSNSLSKFFGVSAKEILGSIDGNRRAENLSIDEWIELTHNFLACKECHTK